MKKIIVPIDFSENAMSGLRLAIIYANTFNADIQMVFVQAKSPGKFAISQQQERKIADENFDGIIKEYQKELKKGQKLDYIVKKGKIYEEVAEQAEAFNDTVIITSTHGETGFNELFMGSNTYRIIQATVRSVISISSCNYQSGPKKIVMPIDITSETREKVPMVAQIAQAFDAEVHILKVTTSTSEGIHNKLKMYSRQVAKYFDERGIKYEKSLIVGDNITSVTVEYAKTVEANLIAIMTEQTWALSNLILGSYAHQMLNSSPIPVLSVTPKNITRNMNTFRTTGG